MASAIWWTKFWRLIERLQKAESWDERAFLCGALRGHVIGEHRRLAQTGIIDPDETEGPPERLFEDRPIPDYAQRSER